MVARSGAQTCPCFSSGSPIVVQPKKVHVDSDAGYLPIRQFDNRIGRADRFINSLEDPRAHLRGAGRAEAGAVPRRRTRVTRRDIVRKPTAA
jgi:hypothetical protein